MYLGMAKINQTNKNKNIGFTLKIGLQKKKTLTRIYTVYLPHIILGIDKFVWLYRYKMSKSNRARAT